MRKVRHHEALKIYHAELTAHGHQAVYEPKLETKPRIGAADLSWWVDKLDEGEGDTARTALFRTYLRIATGDVEIEVGVKLPAQGLRIAPKGRWYMDKWVIAKLHQKGCSRLSQNLKTCSNQFLF